MLGVFFLDASMVIIEFYGYEEKVFQIQDKMSTRGGFLAWLGIMFLAGFTPLPFKIFCISAGLAKVSFVPFLLGSIIGRGLRFLLVGMLAYKYGTKFEEILKSKKVGYLMIGLISFLIIYLYYKWK